MKSTDFINLVKTTKSNIDEFSKQKDGFIELLKERNKSLPTGQKDKIFNTAVEMVTAGKVDPHTYKNKIIRIEEKAITGEDGEVEDKFVKSVEKINKRFKSLSGFMEQYTKKIQDMEKINVNELEELELSEIKGSFEDVSSIFKAIKKTNLSDQKNTAEALERNGMEI